MSCPKSDPISSFGSSDAPATDGSEHVVTEPIIDVASLVLEDDLSDKSKHIFLSVCHLSVIKLYSDTTDRKACHAVLDRLEQIWKVSSEVSKESKHVRQLSFDDAEDMLQSLLAIEGYMATLTESTYDRDRFTMTWHFLSAATSTGVYDSRIRTLIRYVTLRLHMPWTVVEQLEERIVEGFAEVLSNLTEEEIAAAKKKARNQKIKKYALIGTATAVGATILGVTGGLAGPILLPAIFGAGSAAFFGSVGGIVLVSSLFGATGAGLSGYKMNRRVGSIEEFEFVALTEGQQLHVTVAIPGWLSAKNPDVRNGYYSLKHSAEQYVLKYESKFLIELGNSLDYFLSVTTGSGVQTLAKTTMTGASFANVLAWPSMLLSAANIIDNPWSTAMNRTEAVGRHLAAVLIERQQGQRPITLIGYSMGARVVYYCLLELASRTRLGTSGPSPSVRGIIEDAVLLGAPVSADKDSWKKAASVVSGQLINGYCTDDWLLKFIYRTTKAAVSIAGIQPVDLPNERRVFNVCLDTIIHGHGEYFTKLSDTLAFLGFGYKQKRTLTNLASSKSAHAGLTSMSGKTLDVERDDCGVQSDEGQKKKVMKTSESLHFLVLDQAKNRFMSASEMSIDSAIEALDSATEMLNSTSLDDKKTAVEKEGGHFSKESESTEKIPSSKDDDESENDESSAMNPTTEHVDDKQ